MTHSGHRCHFIQGRRLHNSAAAQHLGSQNEVKERDSRGRETGRSTCWRHVLSFLCFYSILYLLCFISYQVTWGFVKRSTWNDLQATNNSKLVKGFDGFLSQDRACINLPRETSSAKDNLGHKWAELVEVNLIFHLSYNFILAWVLLNTHQWYQQLKIATWKHVLCMSVCDKWSGEKKFQNQRHVTCSVPNRKQKKLKFVEDQSGEIWQLES